MEIRHLEYFLAVVEHEGLNRAAQHLFVSQPSLSQAVQALERELGVELFQRNGRRSLVLSSAGALLVPHARAVLDGVVTARDVMARARNLETGAVSIGTMPEMSSDAVVSWTRSFRADHPGVRLDMAEADGAGSLCEDVQNGRYELGFTTEPVPVDTLELVPLGVQRLLLVMPPGTPRPGEPLPLAAVGELPLALCSPARRESDRVVAALGAAGVEPHLVATMPNRVSQLAMVLGGGVNAFLPLRMAVQARRAGAVVVETVPGLSVPFGVVHRRSALSRTAETLVRDCRETLSSWYAAIAVQRESGATLLEAADAAYDAAHLAPTRRAADAAD
ncbi:MULTISPECIES: LysR substrate-binding domain-containing protein [unclassified Pseudonocardia]|uniref:LysR family transcriptional regulator n=1 Tax=unclassified Pseudonocardia TaxID=2619320 RepID=UPI0001FFE429|nr:LysR substrate-binding domain-containing protein [Pseudonocardia sp. Ae707_Ps1]OLM18603.1 transcriptional regulator, LysR family [Pseudonocardia sp. Ae707_Ps1]